MKVGEAKFGSSKKFFKFEDGDNAYRILPALGELADKGIWSMYYKVCWGYKNQEGRTRMFQDCREVNYQTKMVEVESAAYQRLEALKAKQAELKKGGADRETMTKIANMLMRFNIEGKHHVNAVNLKGEIGLLKIGHKAKMALDALVKKLREEEGKNPLAVENGLYINFNRTGKGRDTIYQVSLYKKRVEAEVNGEKRIIEEPVYHTMDEGFQSRLDSEAFELGNMYPAPTSEEISAIVNGGPEVLDQVLDKYKKTRPVVKSEPTASVSPASSDAVDNLLKEEAPSQPATAPVQTAQGASEIEPKIETAPVSTNSEMSDEDFLSMIENG